VYWSCIEDSRTISNLSLLLRVLELNTIWWNESKEKMCKICSKEGLTEERAFILCEKCKCFYHYKCAIKENCDLPEQYFCDYCLNPQVSKKN
jgi:hypothetical protein